MGCSSSTSLDTPECTVTNHDTSFNSVSKECVYKCRLRHKDITDNEYAWIGHDEPHCTFTFVADDLHEDCVEIIQNAIFNLVGGSDRWVANIIVEFAHIREFKYFDNDERNELIPIPSKYLTCDTARILWTHPDFWKIYIFVYLCKDKKPITSVYMYHRLANRICNVKCVYTGCDRLYVEVCAPFSRVDDTYIPTGWVYIHK